MDDGATMNYTSIDFQLVIDIFLLLLIGIGPKIALVPFLDLTKAMDDASKGRVSRKMLTTAGAVALILTGLGELLSRLLHFSTGSLSIAGGIVLVIIAINMVLGSETSERASKDTDPMRLAVFPLAVPYLLNPAGIVALITLSSEADSAAVFAVVLGVLAVVLALDVVVFRWANRVSEHLDASRMLVTEKVFGVLLSALAVQLVLNGLDSVGVIELGSH
jgi:MarC family membrane protein